MKHNRVIAGIFFLLCLVLMSVGTSSCGGGSGGTDGTNGSTGGPYTSIRMEAVPNAGGTAVDPTNIFVNEQIRFRLTGVNTSNIRVVIPTSNYSMTGTPGGTIDSTGLFTAAAAPTGNSGTVRVNFDATVYSLPVQVVAPQAILVGTGRTTENFPGAGIQVNALNSSGAIVASGFISTSGTIRMSVPTTAVRFTTNFSIVDVGPNFYYVRQFAYNGFDYSTTIASCTAPLPPLTNGVTTSLLSSVVFYRASNGFPPPPPNGCQ